MRKIARVVTVLTYGKKQGGWWFHTVHSQTWPVKPQFRKTSTPISIARNPKNNRNITSAIRANIPKIPTLMNTLACLLTKFLRR